jgi:Ser/Thr protein kinase RdoA (MazF antagonist)
MPVVSQNGILLELIQSEGIQFHIAAFIKGKGIRVPDNGYRYRDDAPIEEYFQNWGQMLGKMHCVTKGYQPLSSHIKRPEWFELHKNRLELTQQFPNELKVVRDRIQSTLQELKSLPKDRDS